MGVQISRRFHSEVSAQGDSPFNTLSLCGHCDIVAHSFVIFSRRADMPQVIKVCRIEDEKTARALRWLAVDWIGLHAIDGITDFKARRYRRIGMEFRRSPGCGVALLTKVKSETNILSMLRTVDQLIFSFIHNGPLRKCPVCGGQWTQEGFVQSG